MVDKENAITSYKGFHEDLKCHDFQYEVGKEYLMEDDIIEPCIRGFHTCEKPLDVLWFYGNIFKDRYCTVEQYGNIKKSYKDCFKTVSSKINIKEEIGLDGIFNSAIEWVKNETNINDESVTPHNDSDNDVNKTKTASNEKIISKDNETIASNDHSTKIGSTAYDAKIASSGKYATIGSIGENAQIALSGDYPTVAASGYYSQIASSSHSAKIASNGEMSQIALNGSHDIIGSIGDESMIASNGCFSMIYSSGSKPKIISNGYHANIVSKGYNATISTTGREAKVESVGETSVVTCVGLDSIAKAKKGSWITLSEWKYSEEKGRVIPFCIKTEYVDGERIKGDTWYKLENGEFVEVEP